MIGIVLGTGPSLSGQKADILRLKENGYMLFGINNTYRDFPLDVWIACDPKWHEIYSPVEGDFEKWHWDKGICERYGYKYIEGRWGDGPNRCSGLSKEDHWIAYGHSSGFQALGLAAHYGCHTVILAGYDMHYLGVQRHYFSGLSDERGEYPDEIRKYSEFDGLITCYETVASQSGIPKIFNATKSSALKCFPFVSLDELS